MQQTSEGVADLGVTMAAGAGQIVVEAARLAYRVAVLVQSPGGEVVGVGVYADQATGTGSLQREGLDRRDGPGSGQVPASTVEVFVDAVGDRPVPAHPVTPLVTPMRERHLRGQNVPAMACVRQMIQRGRQLEGNLTVGRDADRLIPVPLSALPVRLQKTAFGLPPRTPFGLGKLSDIQVVPVTQQPLTTTHDTNPPRVVIGPRPLKPILKQIQPPGFDEPLLARVVAAWGLLGAFRPDRQRQPVRGRGYRRLEIMNVGELGTPRQRPLVMVRFGDRTGPP
ncbi:hypothetical protein GCM10023191_087120 [Actinoallomurus oryzae]|uniref:Uncharacterized protein n=1 Tax=Actinoallomurus oryzae TaxID=502180 RepID=A0ABP8R289_9ACTN